MVKFLKLIHFPDLQWCTIYSKSSVGVIHKLYLQGGPKTMTPLFLSEYERFFNFSCNFLTKFGQESWFWMSCGQLEPKLSYIDQLWADKVRKLLHPLNVWTTCTIDLLQIHLWKIWILWCSNECILLTNGICLFRIPVEVFSINSVYLPNCRTNTFRQENYDDKII